MPAQSPRRSIVSARSAWIARKLHASPMWTPHHSVHASARTPSSAAAAAPAPSVPAIINVSRAVTGRSSDHAVDTTNHPASAGTRTQQPWRQLAAVGDQNADPHQRHHGVDGDDRRIVAERHLVAPPGPDPVQRARRVRHHPGHHRHEHERGAASHGQRRYRPGSGPRGWAAAVVTLAPLWHGSRGSPTIARWRPRRHHARRPRRRGRRSRRRRRSQTDDSTCRHRWCPAPSGSCAVSTDLSRRCGREGSGSSSCSMAWRCWR